MYDNAEAEIQIVMAAIEKVYHEKYPKKPLNTKYLENHRGARRKSKLSADDREKLLRMQKKKMPTSETAHETGISERSIYKLLRGA